MPEGQGKKLAEGLQEDCPNPDCKKGQVKEKNQWVNCPVCGGAAKVNKTEEQIKKERKEKKEKKTK